MIRHWTIPILACWVTLSATVPVAFGGPETADGADGADDGRALPVTVASSLPPPTAQDRLLELHHAQWVRGELEQVRRDLVRLLDDRAVTAQARAEAGLRLAAIAERAGDRRQALTYLRRVERLISSGHPLWRRGAQMRQRLHTAITDLRGPVPGSFALRGESARVATRFRRAEKLLEAYYRVVVAPRLENVDAVLRTKRRALAAAEAAYQRVAEAGGPVAKVAAHYRVASMYHHLAEALAFDRPPELLPSVAQQLTRRLRTASVDYLRRALTRYRAAVAVGGGGTAASRWRTLAQREVRTLSRVLGRADAARVGAPGKREE
jgi:hypothetical protein